MRKLIVSLSVVGAVACGGPDAAALVGGEDTDVDAVETLDSELTSSSKATTWLPVTEANSWTFESPSGATRTVKLVQVGSGMALMQGLLGADTWVGVTSSSANTLFAWDGAAWQPFVRFGYAYSEWRYGSGTCTGFKLKRAATGRVVTTAAGTFSDTRVIAVQQVPDPLAFCAPPAVRELTFAANVGLIAFTTGRGEVFTLKRATVAGLVLPSSPVQATLTLDKASYLSLPNTIRCITTPCPSNEQTAVAKATFVVKNTGAQAVSWSFNTGCQFDIDVTSASGALVKRFSRDVACTMALSQVTLAPGQSKTYSADLKLADDNGLQLSGTFGLRARLIPRGGAAAPAAAASLSVRIQP